MREGMHKAPPGGGWFRISTSPQCCCRPFGRFAVPKGAVKRNKLSDGGTFFERGLFWPTGVTSGGITRDADHEVCLRPTLLWNLVAGMRVSLFSISLIICIFRPPPQCRWSTSGSANQADGSLPKGVVQMRPNSRGGGQRLPLCVLHPKVGSTTSKNRPGGGVRGSNTSNCSL